jgi:hypothetical protein
MHKQQTEDIDAVVKMVVDIDDVVKMVVVSPYWFMGQLCISRNKFDYKFD